MKLSSVYLGLCVLGTMLPYSQFIPFLREHGLNIGLFVEQLFANRIAGFFGDSQPQVGGIRNREKPINQRGNVAVKRRNIGAQVR